MFPFLKVKIGAQAHPATITHDRSKLSKERMVARIGNIQASLDLDKKRDGGMSREKKENLKNEIKGILAELDAREDTLNEIVSKIVGE